MRSAAFARRSADRREGFLRALVGASTVVVVVELCVTSTTWFEVCRALQKTCRWPCRKPPSAQVSRRSPRLAPDTLEIEAQREASPPF
jgi:hypothetical protein